MPIVRRIIKPTRKHGAIYMIERVAFRDKPVRITLEIDPEVTIDKLVFQPVRKKLPPAAAAYVPKIVPRPDRPRLLVNRETLPVILDRMKRGANARAWAEVQQIARKPFVFKVLPGREVQWDGALVKALRCKAFYYLATGDEKVARRAAKRILTGRDAHTVEGVFYPPPFPDGPEAAASRTEITALPGEAATRFLHVLQPTPGTAAEPVAMTEKDGVVTLASKGWPLVLAPARRRRRP